MLRAEGLSVRAELGNRKLGRQLETASQEHAHFAVIIGDELADGHVQLKDLEAGTQRLVPLTELAEGPGPRGEEPPPRVVGPADLPGNSGADGTNRRCRGS